MIRIFLMISPDVVSFLECGQCFEEQKDVYLCQNYCVCVEDDEACAGTYGTCLGWCACKTLFSFF